MQPTPVNPGGWNPNSQPTTSTASSLSNVPAGKPGVDSVTFGQRLAIQQQNGWVQQMLHRLQLARALQNPNVREALAKQHHTPWYQQIWLWGAVTAVVIIGIAGHHGGWWKKLAQSSNKNSRPPALEIKPPEMPPETTTATPASNGTPPPPALTPLERLKADLAASPDAAKAAIDRIEAEATEENSRKELLQLATKHPDLDVVQKAIGKFQLLENHQTSLKGLLESQINHGNLNVQKTVIAQLDHVTDLEHLESLLKQAMSPDRDTSVATLAASKFVKMKPEQEKLKELILMGLDHPHADVKKAMIQQSEHITEPVNLQPVLKKASQATMPSETATLAANQFSRMQSEQTQLRDLIMQGLQHPNLDVQKATAGQFEHITDLVHLQSVLKKAMEPAMPPQIAILAINKLSKMQSEQAQLRDLIMQGLQHPSLDVQKATARQFEHITDPVHLQPVVQNAITMPSEIANLAVNQLSRMQAEQEKLKELISAGMQHDDLDVKKATISQLWHVQNTDWQNERIVEALKDADSDVGDHALEEIKSHSPAVQVRIENDEDSSDAVQEQLFSKIKEKRNLLADLAYLRQNNKEQINTTTIQNLINLTHEEAEVQATLQLYYEKGIKPNNALHEAIRNHHTWALDAALKAGVSPYAKDEVGLLPLHQAAFHGNRQALTKVLDEMKIDIPMENSEDCKTLDDLKPEIIKAGKIAANFGHLEILNFLQAKYGNEVISDELATLAKNQAERIEELKNSENGTSLSPEFSSGNAQNVEKDYLETLASFRSGWHSLEPDWSEGIVQSRNEGAIKALLELGNFKASWESSNGFKDALAENITEVGTLIPDQNTRMEILNYALSTKDVLGFPVLNAEKVARLIGQLETLIDDPGNRAKVLKQAFSATNENGYPLISAKTATQIIDQLQTLVDPQNQQEITKLAQKIIQNESSLSKAFRYLWGGS